MLPSTGLFKSFACPYFDSGGTGSSGCCNDIEAKETSCQRPYCHYKHIRREEQQPAGEQAAPAVVSAVPKYKPAPKLLSLPKLTIPSAKKRAQLEYQPEKPELNASPSKKRLSAEDVQAPVYIPAPANMCKVNVAADSAGEALDLDDCAEELDELSGIIDEEQLLLEDTEGIKGSDNDVGNGEKSPENRVNGDLADAECNEKKEEEEEEEEEEEIVKQEEERQRSPDVRVQERGEEEGKGRGKDKRASTSSSDLHNSRRHKSTSKSKENNNNNNNNDNGEHKLSKDSERRRDRDKNKESSRHHDREREKGHSRERERDKRRTTSNSKHKSSSSHRNGDRDTGLKDKRNHQSSSSSPSSSKHRSSSTTSSKSKNSNSTSSKASLSDNSESRVESSLKTPSSSSQKYEFDNETAALFATTEEDIMKECEMIYNQLEQEFASLHQDDADGKAAKEESEKSSALKRMSSREEDYTVAPQKRRVAYENADKYKSPAPTVAHKPNHIRNAMQAIFNRQNVFRRKQEEEAAAAAAALREAEEKVREANEALRKVQEKTQTPLIPKTYLTPPPAAKTFSRSIAPVANILALERAKKKVEELRAEKKPSFTPAQTTKGAPRIAHKATAKLTNVEPEKQAKPPVLEANSSKISFNIRMQYYEMMVKHCLVIYPNVADAWERAQTEELAVLKKCNTPVIYKSSALLTINKLRKEAADSGNRPLQSNKIVSHEVILAGKLATNTSWSVQKKMKTDATVGGEPFDKLPSDKAYEMVYELRLTEEQLVSNGYPRPGKQAGTAVITFTKPMKPPNDTERYCSRCGKLFNLSMYDEVCVDECNYHPKGTGYRRGFADNYHRCCQQPAGTPGCTYGNYHVTDFVDIDNLTGYVTTIDKNSSGNGGPEYGPSKKDIYALDCEMCYTTQGIELTRVTVVDINARTVYDALVKPDNKIVDYNTVYSGITEQMLTNETRTLRDVQAILMSMFHSRTVLVGHSLESDLKALKLIHGIVVDTSVLFPHKMGPPKKRALKTLCVENLKRIIQENEAGHDSAEDAEVCIQLVKFYLRNKIS